MKNRTALLIVSCIILITLLCFTPPTYAVENQQTNIFRAVYITDWGATVINDTITVHNTSPEEISKFRIGIPLDLQTHLRYSTAKNAEGAPLKLERVIDEDNTILWFDITLLPIPEGETSMFYVSTVFSDLITFYQGGFTCNFVDTPLTHQQITRCNVTFILPVESTFNIPGNLTFQETQYNGLPALSAEFSPLQPYSTQMFNFSFKSITLQLFRVHLAERQITFQPFGGLAVEDLYSVTNLSTSVSYFNVLLPKGSYNIMVFDEVGPITDKPQESDVISVSPRYQAIRNNESFTFTLKYNIPNSYLRHSSILGPYELEANLLTPQPFIINSLHTELVLPPGFTLSHINRSPDLTTSNLFSTRYYFNSSDITPLSDLKLTVKGQFDLFGSALRPLGWIIMIVVAVGALYMALKERKPITRIVTTPSKHLSKVTELIDEKIKLRSDLEKLDEKFTTRTISRNEYRRQRKNIEIRLMRVNRLIKPLQDEASRLNLRYVETLKKVDKAEAEMEATRISMRNVKIQYRMGKISKEAYKGVLSDLAKKHENAKSRMEQLNIMLKEQTEQTL